MYGVLEEKGPATEMVRRALDAGYANLEWMRRDGDLQCLHGDPDFERLTQPA